MHQMTMDELAEGRQLRDEGMAAVSANPANAMWRGQAEDALRVLASAGRPFTAADVVRLAGLPPSHNAVGALFNAAKRAGRIKHTGRWVRSPRKASHARELREWIAA